MDFQWCKNMVRALFYEQNQQSRSQDIVNQKLIIDDDSKDNTIAIALKYGWTVIKK